MTLSLAFHIIFAASGIGLPVAFLSLWTRRFALARIAAIAEVMLILIGWD
jgi:hypothetical protein